MAAVHGDPYWKYVWAKWCDVMCQLHLEGGDAHLGLLEQIVCPTLILHGRTDALISDFHPNHLLSRIRTAHLYEFAEGGHSLHLQCASEFNRIVSGFIS
jgi:valacyclovir hydrolase